MGLLLASNFDYCVLFVFLFCSPFQVCEYPPSLCGPLMCVQHRVTSFSILGCIGLALSLAPWVAWSSAIVPPPMPVGGCMTQRRPAPLPWDQAETHPARGLFPAGGMYKRGDIAMVSPSILRRPESECRPQSSYRPGKNVKYCFLFLIPLSLLVLLCIIILLWSSYCSCFFSLGL